MRAGHTFEMASAAMQRGGARASSPEAPQRNRTDVGNTAPLVSPIHPRRFESVLRQLHGTTQVGLENRGTMDYFIKALRSKKEGWMNKTAKLRRKIRRLRRKNETIGRAIAANKAFLFVDMFCMMDRGGVGALGVGDNSRNPLYHDAAKSEYLSRIMYAARSAQGNGDTGERVGPRDPAEKVLYPAFANRRPDLQGGTDDENKLQAGM